MTIVKPKEKKTDISLLMQIEKQNNLNSKPYFEKVIILSDKDIIYNKLKKNYTYKRFNPIHHNNSKSFIYNSSAIMVKKNIYTKNELECRGEKQRSFWRSINDSYLKRNISLPPLISRLKDSQPRNERENRKEIIIVGEKLHFN